MRPTYDQWKQQSALREISEAEARRRWEILNNRMIMERYTVPVSSNAPSSGGTSNTSNKSSNDFNNDFNNDFR